MSRVLLVEDDPAIAELIEEVLHDDLHLVSVAHDDQTAYAKLEAEPRAFEVLVADVDLGVGTTGFDVARRARKLNPDVQVIYISGATTESDRFGVEGAILMPKPFAPRALARRVKAARGEARGRMKPPPAVVPRSEQSRG